MDVEFWNSVFKSATMWLGLLTALAAGAGWYTESIVSDRQAARLRDLGKEIAGARTQQAQAETRLKSVEGETAKQQERAANAEESAAQAKRQLLELQERLKPRQLTSEQRVRLLESLRKIPKGPLVFEAVLGDAESSVFAGQIAAIFKEAGWTHGGVMLSSFRDRNPTGYGILIRDANNVPAHAGPMQKAFEDAGLPLVADVMPTIEAGMVRFVVGVRP